MKQIIKRMSFSVVLGLMMIQGLKASDTQLIQLSRIFQKDSAKELNAFINLYPAFNWNGQYNCHLLIPSWNPGETVTPLIAATVLEAPSCVNTLLNRLPINISLTSSRNLTALNYAQTPKGGTNQATQSILQRLNVNPLLNPGYNG